MSPPSRRSNFEHGDAGGHAVEELDTRPVGLDDDVSGRLVRAREEAVHQRARSQPRFNEEDCTHSAAKRPAP